MQTGATMEIGALPLDRDRLLNRAPRTPTRLVSASGHLGSGATSADMALPLHRSIAEAFSAIAAAGTEAETVRIVDSAFYAGVMLNWPANLRHLIVEAAAGARPMLELAGSTPGAAAYDTLALTGLALLPTTSPFNLALPPAQDIALEFVSVLDAELTLIPVLREAAGAERLAIVRCTLGPLRLAESGALEIDDTIVDAGDPATLALDAQLARLRMDRATVLGQIAAGEVDISDSVLAGAVTARERFRGCVRFSLLAPGGATPRKHRVVRTDAVTDAPIRPPFLSRDRRDPAYLRLDPDGDPRVLAGASDGGEMGAFNRARLGELLAGLWRRLAEHTPAGLRTGVVLRH
jgi:hypothetical protein